MLIHPNVSTHGRSIAGPGVSLYVETYGDPSQPALLLTHGIYQSSQCWSRQVHELSKHWFVVTWDLPYHGLSGPYGPEEERVAMTPISWAQAMRAVVDEYDLAKKGFVQVAWSFGGLVTHHYLLTYGVAGMRGIVLVGSMLDFTPLFSLVDTMQILMAIAAPDAAISDPAYIEFVNRLWYEAPSVGDFSTALGYNILAYLRNNPANTFIPIEGNIDDFLTLHTLPILLIQGKEDKIIPASLAVSIAEKHPHCTILAYENVGHSPFYERAARFNQDVHAFGASISH